MTWYKKSQEEDYRGTHEAPDRGNGSPLHDLSGLYPDDIYSADGARYYGHYGGDHPMDHQAISILRQYRNKPNARLTVYRAAPNVNYDTQQKIKKLSALSHYYSNFGFFPVGNDIIHEIEDKYSLDEYGYDERQRLVLADLRNRITALEGEKDESIGINVGDWVALTRAYAKEHGESNLGGKYKIISKNVKASDIFTEGYIQEWGYDPQ